MINPNIFALYLPQFHQTKENDEWWGKGFTEWNSVKSAKKLSPYSYQPRIPLNAYYDLSDIKSIRKQVELANKYGVDGFAIYHYYSNGKVLLEKPSKLLKNNRDIDIKYFFSWANHDWRRTWYGYNMEILQKQEYGNREQIVEHYRYLADYFLDERYYKINNCPVFAIYKYSYISNFQDYYKIWNELAKKDGFKGMYFIQTLERYGQERDSSYFDASFDFEPGYTIQCPEFKATRFINKIKTYMVKRLKFQFVSQVFNYEKVCKVSARHKHNDPKQYYGVFRGWDNTPRHKLMGTVYKNENVEYFKYLLEKQYAKALEANHEMIVINAWNEWSEGAYLEPDKDRKYKLLEAISEIKSKHNKLL